MRMEDSQREAIADICRRYRVRKLGLFGSVATGTAGPNSDVDLLVEFTPGQAPTGFELVHMREELQKVFHGRKIDLAFPSILQNAWRRSAIEPQLQTVFQ